MHPQEPKSSPGCIADSIGPEGAVAGAAPGGGFGPPVAIALIMGSIIGVGIFNLPTSLAIYGPITLVSMALTTVGAIALALMFAALSRRLPAEGGPYAYARAAFGNRVGFSTRGRTGSAPGPATRGSLSAGFSTSRYSSTRARTSCSRSCSCWSACGCPP
jgi:hypothetical protein